MSSSQGGDIEKGSTNTDVTTSAKTVWTRMLRIDWLGQMAASIFWTISVFVYGFSEAGDYLQLAAAISWVIANLAALMSTDN